MGTERSPDAKKLCLSCGLCCNGVLFADVRLQAEDTAEKLRRLGLPIAADGKAGKFAQPCAALTGCRCGIYADRPAHCRAFECLLLKRTLAGEIGRDAALGIINRARQQVEAVTALLRALGENDETLPLRRRFQRQAQRLARAKSSKETSALFSELTLAFHDLTLLLQQSFYPGK